MVIPALFNLTNNRYHDFTFYVSALHYRFKCLLLDAYGRSQVRGKSNDKWDIGATGIVQFVVLGMRVIRININLGGQSISNRVLVEAY